MPPVQTFPLMPILKPHFKPHFLLFHLHYVLLRSICLFLRHVFYFCVLCNKRRFLMILPIQVTLLLSPFLGIIWISFFGFYIVFVIKIHMVIYGISSAISIYLLLFVTVNKGNLTDLKSVDQSVMRVRVPLRAPSEKLSNF